MIFCLDTYGLFESCSRFHVRNRSSKQKLFCRIDATDVRGTIIPHSDYAELIYRNICALMNKRPIVILRA